MSRPNTIDAVMHEIHLGHTGQSCGCAWCANDPFCWDCDHCTEWDNAPCAGDSVDGWAAWDVPCGWCMRARAAEGVEPVPSAEELLEVELWEQYLEERREGVAE